jgi:hypothetical protein
MRQTTRRGRMARRQRRLAGGWENKAVAGLADEEGEDVSDFEWEKSRYMRNAIQVEYGRMEWMVFKDDSDAEKAAVEYVKDMIESEGIEVFNKDFAMKFITIDDSTRSQIAQEDADSYLGDMSTDDIESDLSSLESWADTSKFEDLVEEIEDKEMERDGLDEDEDDYDDKYDKLDGEVDKLEDKKDGLLDDIRDEAMEGYAEEVEDRIKDDLLGWLGDLGYDLSREMPSFISVDEDAMAQEAVDTDGAAHFLAGYDGDEVDLDGGAVAYRTN